MANQEQLEILKQGVEKWNEWRSRHPDQKIDLVKASLSGVDLRRDGVFGANLIGADLSWADLSWADLGEANLYGANLRGADLSRRRANLRGTNLRGAVLAEANFFEAFIGATNLTDLDLRYAAEPPR